MPTGPFSPEAVVLPPVEVKFGWPITAVAFMPLLNGGANTSTRE